MVKSSWLKSRIGIVVLVLAALWALTELLLTTSSFFVARGSDAIVEVLDCPC